MFYLYILESLKDGKMHIGYTNNLKRRFKEHNSGQNFSTAHRKPFKLICYEAYLHKEDAKERERFLKTGWGRQYLKRSLKYYLSCQNLKNSSRSASKT